MNIKRSGTHFKKLNLGKGTAFGIAILVGLTALSINASAVVVIDFEDLTTTGLGQPDHFKLFNEYAETKGIIFKDNPVAIDYSKGRAIQGFAHSGTKAIEQCYGNEFCTTPIIMNFTAGQKHVKVWVGYSGILTNRKIGVALRAFDLAGKEIGVDTSGQIGPSDSPVPIKYPMEVVSDSENIYSAIVENFYTGYNEYVAVDDIEFDTAGPPPPCTSTRDPIVTLTQPSGQTVQFNDLILQGTVSTTAPLESATLIVTGSGGSKSFDLISYDEIPRFGGNLIARFSNDMLFPGKNTIDVKVEDCKGSGQASGTVTYEPITKDTSIKFMGMEVTQAIQDMQNSVPLIEDKRTVVRAYLRVEGSTSQINKIRGNLYAYNVNLGKDPIYGYPSYYLVPIKPYMTTSSNSININSLNDIISKRQNIDDSLIFELPPQWIKEGNDLHLELILSSEGHPIDCDGCENRAYGYYNTVKFEKAPPVQVVLWNVPYSVVEIDPTCQCPKSVKYSTTQNDFNLAYSWLQRAYPAGMVIKIQKTMPAFDHLPTPGEVNYRLNIEHSTTKEISQVKYYGLINDTSTNYPDGVGLAKSTPGNVSSGTKGIYGDLSFSRVGHELGHLYGRKHVKSDPSVQKCPGDEGKIDDKYPFPKGLISGPDRRFFGFDLGDPSNGISRKVYNPLLVGDMMSYCQNRWPSNYTYENILDELKNLYGWPIKGSSFSLIQDNSVPEDTILVQGELNLTDNSINMPLFMHLPGLELTSRPENSPFSIDLLDKIGNRLASYPFEPKYYIEDTDSESKLALIAEIIPYVDGTNRIVIIKNAKELVSRNITLNPPQVKVLYPNGGEELHEITNVTWQASDADRDELIYILMYSNDEGKTWQTVAIDLKKSNYLANLGELPGGNRSLFRVIATDGFNTGQDDSDAVFNVPNKAPQTRIISPGDNSTFTTAQTILFVGDAFDWEDNYLDGEALEWSSDKQGVLGFNRSISTAGLMPGNHTITLTAKDKNGNVGSTSIQVQITQVAPVANAGKDQTVTVGSAVQLNGSKSSGFGQLLYNWEVVAKPDGSQANLMDAGTAQAEFVADLPGEYIIQLLVKDAISGSAIDRAIIKAAPGGNISGMKFNDSNGNGIKDANESGLVNWTILLTKPDGTTVSTTTNASGNYIFANLTAGNYTVEEVHQQGWKQTAPSGGTYTVTISSGDNVKDKNFGNEKVSISGMKFNDKNGNGKRDGGEEGLAGWRIRLVGVDTLTMTPVNREEITDANGNYGFRDVSPGIYQVFEMIDASKAGWVPTTPVTVPIKLKAGETINVNFGNKKIP